MLVVLARVCSSQRFVYLGSIRCCFEFGKRVHKLKQHSCRCWQGKQANPQRPLSSDDPSLKRMQSMAYGLQVSQVFTVRLGATSIAAEAFPVFADLRDRTVDTSKANRQGPRRNHGSVRHKIQSELAQYLQPQHQVMKLQLRSGLISSSCWHMFGTCWAYFLPWDEDFQRPETSRSSAADLGSFLYCTTACG